MIYIAHIVVRNWSGMSDLINRQDVIDAIHYYIESGYKCDIFQELKNLPSAEPKRTAKVVSDDVIITVNGYRYHYDEYLCNACKKKVFSGDSYCSHCGVKLDWSRNE